MEVTTFISPDQVRWEQFEKMGINRERLEKAHQLEKLLNYEKTSLMGISVQAGDQSVYTDARLSLRRNEDGTYSPAVTPVRKELNLSSVYMGHTFSDEQKKKLIETGNLGETIVLKRSDNSEFNAYISVDRLTNTLVCADADKIRIPQELGGLQLTAEQQEALKLGREVALRGFKTKEGDLRDVTIQINAEKRGIEFKNAPIPANEYKTILGVQLTDKDREKFSRGEAIYLRGMKTGDGKVFDSYVKYDSKQNRARFYNNNPDNPSKKTEQKKTQNKTKSKKQTASPKVG